MKHTWVNNTCTRCGCKMEKQWSGKFSYYLYTRSRNTSTQYIECIDWNDNTIVNEEIMGWKN